MNGSFLFDVIPYFQRLEIAECATWYDNLHLEHAIINVSPQVTMSGTKNNANLASNLVGWNCI